MHEARSGDVAPEAVLRLANGFLDGHHVEAARVLARLFDRAQMMQRVTMSYDPTRVGGSRGKPQQAELADSAAEARQRLGRMAATMPGDCWGVLTDICGFDKGLQLIEAERNWPRRSAKLVLRIGLEHLAMSLGLAPVAAGAESGLMRSWLPERPPMFAD
ncbi:MAG: hypothetical protein GX970_04775 [Phyllobacteriaceae bacterium]|nr:hypothetical protein [Phyllobacteriaceae bacterium]